MRPLDGLAEIQAEMLTVEGGAIKDLGEVGMKPMRS